MGKINLTCYFSIKPPFWWFYFLILANIVALLFISLANAIIFYKLFAIFFVVLYDLYFFNNHQKVKNIIALECDDYTYFAHFQDKTTTYKKEIKIKQHTFLSEYLLVIYFNFSKNSDYFDNFLLVLNINNDKYTSKNLHLLKLYLNLPKLFRY